MAAVVPGNDDATWLDRVLSVFAPLHAGESVTVLLLLANIFLLLICYSVIKTVREPLVLLGGGAVTAQAAAAGQAILLMGFVPFYSWLASKVNRLWLILGVTLFFVLNLELFSMAVAAHVPYVGIAFFIWVGVFNISLVAQFWSYANDLYTKEAGDRLFPIITIGMTAGAPLGSFIAARLFGRGVAPQVILQVSAGLLLASLVLYLLVNGRETRRAEAPEQPLAVGSGFGLVLQSRYLRLIAALIILLNVVNTTGEYLRRSLVQAHADALLAANAGFNREAYIGVVSGDYQFWVNVVAFSLQAFVTARVIKYGGLRAVLLALPLIALGGYAVIAAGVGFAVVNGVKIAENATDYSLMNTARQLLWLPTAREEKYKAKQAIDTFFVRFGDVLSFAIVYLGTKLIPLSISSFALGNVLLTLLWIGVAVLILRQHQVLTARVEKAA